MDLNSVYTDLIMHHNNKKENKGELEDPDLSEHGHNPNCGDDITLDLNIEDQQELRKLKDAMALKNISNMPARVKCAVLSWHTLKEALNERN